MKKKAWEKLTTIKYIGEKTAKKLYAGGYRKKIRILKEDPARLAKIVGPIAYKITNANKRIKLKKPQARERRGAVKALTNIFLSGFELFKNFLFRKKKTFKIGIYGSTNAGKTTLANRISMDFTGGEMGTVSKIPHETKAVTIKKGIELNAGDKKIIIDLADTPGFSASIDYRMFIKYGLSKKDAEQRAKEAAIGVIQAIRWLDEADVVLVMVDATQKPHMQENMMLLPSLKFKKIPTVIVANKMDLKRANILAVAKAFPEYRVVGISAKNGENMDNFYRCVVETASSI